MVQTKLQLIEDVRELVKDEIHNRDYFSYSIRLRQCLKKLDELENSLKKQNPDQNFEWYTPPEIIYMVRQVLGERIWLDPASNEQANKTVKALKYFTKEDDGLQRFWRSPNLFCNPPYGKNTKLFLRKCMRSPVVKEAIFLVNRTGAAWYCEILESGYWNRICMVRKRIAFYDSTGIKQTSPRYYNDILYHGSNLELFDEVFETIGKVSNLP